LDCRVDDPRHRLADLTHFDIGAVVPRNAASLTVPWMSVVNPARDEGCDLNPPLFQ
jgi:hypothetical protein